MTVIYPNAGQDYYLIHTPVLKSATFHLANGRDFTIKADGLSEKNIYISSATLNGKPYPYSTIKHADIMNGGTLVLNMASKPSDWGKALWPESNPK